MQIEALIDRVDALIANPSLVACAGNTSVLKDGNDDEIITTSFQTYNLADIALYRTTDLFYIHTSAILWRNIYPENIPPMPNNFYDIKGDPALMNMMLGKKWCVHRLNKTVSTYRITGKGRFTQYCEEEQRQRNLEYEAKVLSIWPLRHKILQRIAAHPRARTIAKYLIKIGLLPQPYNL